MITLIIIALLRVGVRKKIRRIIENNTELRPLWAKIFNFDWKFGSFLILIICIPRFLLVLDANASGNYSLIGAVMIVSAIAPFIFLNKSGRRKIGIIGTRKYKWILKAFIFGVAASLLLYSYFSLWTCYS